MIARGSVMQYAGTTLPIPQIAQELNVEMIMTGTVRLAGDQVRVTAQLIDGMTNLPVWTTEDDGDLSDIFAIQSDIAMSIANSLQAQFSTAEQESVEAIPTDSTEAYTLYLRALALAREGIRGGLRATCRAEGVARRRIGDAVSAAARRIGLHIAAAAIAARRQSCLRSSC